MNPNFKIQNQNLKNCNILVVSNYENRNLIVHYPYTDVVIKMDSDIGFWKIKK
jgi:hypothetical protein